MQDKPTPLRQATEILDQTFYEMRWRCLSLAADLDRIGRGHNGREVLVNDPRLHTLRKAIRILLEDSPHRAERVQMLFSDTSPRP